MNTYERQPRALAIIDGQNDFIDGSLAVPGGKRPIEAINKLTRAYIHYSMLIATTQDKHPKETAHFSDEPNYVDTWPVHCVAGTRGAELHPDLEVAKHSALARRFIKGTEACESPADDNSYSGVFAHNPETGLYLPEWLDQHDIEEVDVVGYAIGDGDEHPHCVDSTAIGLSERGYRVNVITDAVEEVLPENRAKCFRNLARKGIRLLTLDQALQEIGHETA
jgi:nicotinamidase/pyrazinamidase